MTEKVTENNIQEQKSYKLDDNTLDDMESLNDYHNQEIAKFKKQIDDLEDKLLRSIAESENIRKRFEKSLEETKEYSIANFAKDLLNVMDNLSRAIEYKNDHITSNLIEEGLKMTKKELSDVFLKHGLETITPSPGDKFNYNIHYAVSQISDSNFSENCIVDTMQIGYKIKNRLLRPAMVSVSKNQ